MIIKSILISIFLLLLSNCKEKDCQFDSKYNNKKYTTEKSLNLLILPEESNCTKLFLKGEFGYFLKGYNVEKTLYMRDSVYSYSRYWSEDQLFDFSSKKESGSLVLNDSINLKVKYFKDIPFENENFRLFEVENIAEFETLNLSLIYITNYKYGIVGEFILVKENNILGVVNPKGFIPNEKLFYTIFEKVELL